MEQKSKGKTIFLGAYTLVLSIVLFISGLVTFVSQTELFRPKGNDFALSSGLLFLAITFLGIFFHKWGKI